MIPGYKLVRRSRFLYRSFLLIFFLSLGLFFSAFSQSAQQIHLGWSKNDVYHTMTVMWWTPTASGANTVFFDTKSRAKLGSYSKKIRAETFRIDPEKSLAGTSIVSQFSGFYHQAELDGLEPRTNYYFRIGNQGKPDDRTREWFFRTLGGKEITFVVGGDYHNYYGGGYEIKASPVSSADWDWARKKGIVGMASEDPDFALFVGDVVQSGNSQAQWRKWFNLIEDNLVTSEGRMIPSVTVVGNHDLGSYPDVDSSYEWFRKQVSNPGNELFFSIDFPGLSITALCATAGSVKGKELFASRETDDQTQWLRQNLLHRREQFSVVALHAPLFNFTASRTSEHPWKELLSLAYNPRYSVDLIVLGHPSQYRPGRSHTERDADQRYPPVMRAYNRLYPKHYHPTFPGIPEKSIPLVVGGRLSLSADNVDGGLFSSSGWNRPAYTVIKIRDRTVEIKTKDTDGKTLNELTGEPLEN